MDRSGRGRFGSTLSASLVLLGLVIIVLAFLDLSRDTGPPGRTPPEASPHSSNTSDRLIQRLEQRQQDRPSDRLAYAELGGSYLRKARETGDPTYYDRAEGALLKALELEPGSPAS